MSEPGNQKQARPRIYCIPATGAAVVAVFLRGPSKWSHVGRWDLDAGTYEPGAWLSATLYPRRCDLSPDGKLLSYFTLNPNSDWEHGNTYVAISKLPRLTALHAFETCGTWTRGYYFTEDGDPALKMPIAYDLRSYSTTQFSVESRRGWIDAPDSLARGPRDMWDEQREARMIKRQPDGRRVLRMERQGYAGRGELAVEGIRVSYSLEYDDDVTLLNDAQWADWDANGNLLVATRSGTLQMRYLNGDLVKVLIEKDLAGLSRENVRSPDWARKW